MDDDDDELFRPKRPGGQQDAGAGGGAAALDALDSSRAQVPAELLDAWRDEGAAERLRNRFVTGAGRGCASGTACAGQAAPGWRRQRRSGMCWP